MPTFTDCSGLFGIALALAALALALPVLRRLPCLWRGGLWLGTVILVLAPFGELSGAAYVRGAVGDLSVTTLVMLMCVHFRRPGETRHSRTGVLVFVAVAALVLYPMALGVGMFDPYRLGYGSPWLVAGVIAMALAAWLARSDLLALVIGLATLAWSFRWYESTNLWDYLIDPLVSFYALGCLLRSDILRLTGTIRAGRNRNTANQNPGTNG
jgi:hypothetical protein